MWWETDYTLDFKIYAGKTTHLASYDTKLDQSGAVVKTLMKNNFIKLFILTPGIHHHYNTVIIIMYLHIKKKLILVEL